MRTLLRDSLDQSHVEALAHRAKIFYAIMVMQLVHSTRFREIYMNNQNDKKRNIV